MNKTKLWPFWSREAQINVQKRIEEGDIYASSVDSTIKKFETDFLKKCAPSQKYAILCNTGTSGLFAAYFALNLEPNSEVLVPTNTFRATVTPMISLGLHPVFCDSEYSTGLIDFEDVVRRITPRTKALVVTHLYGHPVDMDKAIEIASKYDLALIEDCSHAHGAMWKNQNVGTFGDIGIFSLGTKKMISGGTGGIVVTSNKTFYERMVLLCSPKPWCHERIEDPKLRKYISTGIGFNMRGTPISAILANEHLENIDETIQIKNNNLNKLNKIINKYLPDLKYPSRHTSFTYGTFYSYQCRWEHPTIERDTVLNEFINNKFSVDKPSGHLHNQDLFKEYDLIFNHLKKDSRTNDSNNYIQSQRIIDCVIQFDTRDLYENSDDVLLEYERVFEKVANSIY